MGYLHAGHVSLMRRARREVGPAGQVVVSIYVNPTQFGPEEDFTKYPRELARDKRLCREALVDVLFVPSDAEMYPGSEGAPFSTFAVEERLSRAMEALLARRISAASQRSSRNYSTSCYRTCDLRRKGFSASRGHPENGSRSELPVRNHRCADGS